MVQGVGLVAADPNGSITPQAPQTRGTGDANSRAGQAQGGSAKSALLEALSQEVRTTLALVSGYSQTLLHLDLTDEERGRALARISVASQHVAEVTEEMFLVTNSKNDGRPLCQAVSIGSLLSHLSRQLAEEPDPPRLTVHLPADLPLASADPVWIGHVLRDLVTTTARSAGDGRVVRVEARSTGDWVVVGVQGGEEPLVSGPNPLPPSTQQPHRVGATESATAPTARAGSVSHHFDLPVSGSGDPSTRPSLDLCRQLVEAHGGRVWLDETASGELVSFSLPRYRPDPAAIETPRTRVMVAALKP
jgi:signal transduction histidine kinase